MFKISGEVCHQLRVNPYHPGLQYNKLRLEQLYSLAKIHDKLSLLGRQSIQVHAI
jgi:hypothetical protein